MKCSDCGAELPKKAKMRILKAEIPVTDKCPMTGKPHVPIHGAYGIFCRNCGRLQSPPGLKQRVNNRIDDLNPNMVATDLLKNLFNTELNHTKDVMQRLPRDKYGNVHIWDVLQALDSETAQDREKE